MNFLIRVGITPTGPDARRAGGSETSPGFTRDMHAGITAGDMSMGGVVGDMDTPGFNDMHTI